MAKKPRNSDHALLCGMVAGALSKIDPDGPMGKFEVQMLTKDGDYLDGLIISRPSGVYLVRITPGTFYDETEVEELQRALAEDGAKVEELEEKVEELTAKLRSAEKRLDEGYAKIARFYRMKYGVKYE